MFLITGGLGFIGSHTTRAFLDSGFDCVATLHRSAAVPKFLPGRTARLETEPLTMTDGAMWDAIGARHEITGIVHLAAAGIDRPAPDQLLDNLRGLLEAVRCAVDWGVQRVIVASSIGVYAGVDAASGLSEDLALPPIGLHGIQTSKKINELAADLLTRTSNVEVVSVRLPAVWGPLGHPTSRFFALPQMVHAAVRGDRVTVAADDAIDLMYVRDVARAIVSILTTEQLDHSIYNIGTGVATTNRDVALAIRASVPGAGLDLDDSASATTSPSMNIDRLINDTGFAPAFGLEAGIADYVDWLRAGNER
jgi:UDP-glucose 4-epimerase